MYIYIYIVSPNLGQYVTGCYVTQASPLCSRVKTCFGHMLPRCSLVLPLCSLVLSFCSPVLPYCFFVFLRCSLLK